MPPVAVVTDTTHYMPHEMVAAHDIHLVSLYVNWDGRQERESAMPDFGAYYERLRTADPLPTTSQPSIGDFLEVWRPLLDAGRDIVSIHIAAGISGTYQSALQAKDQLAQDGLADRVEVIDSETSCGGLAVIALAAAAAANGGGDREAVAARAIEARDSTRIWFAVDTLEFLRRGGRIGAAQAWLGSALKVKPILTLRREITPVERVRTAGRAVARLVEFMEERKADGADGWMIQHIQDPERAALLVESGREIFGTDPVMVSEIGPVIGTHVGPGLLGVGGGPASLFR
jgi:DegV family protein with EDD domain